MPGEAASSNRTKIILTALKIVLLLVLAGVFINYNLAEEDISGESIQIYNDQDDWYQDTDVQTDQLREEQDRDTEDVVVVEGTASFFTSTSQGSSSTTFTPEPTDGQPTADQKDSVLSQGTISSTSTSEPTDSPTGKDDYLLIPPSQEWIQEQVDKSLHSRGLAYGEVSQWEGCNQRSYYFNNIKTVYTGIPKTGCSNWIEALLRAEGDLDHELDPTKVRKVHGGLSGRHRLGKGKPTMNKYTKEDFDEAFSFTVVRNPWTRMVSAYRDKLSQEDTQGGSFGGIRKSIVSMMRNITDREELTGLYPTFDEYARWVVVRKGKLDAHFAPQWQTLCIPFVKYKYIVPLEFAKQLSPEIWRKIGTSDMSLLGSYDKSEDPRLQKSALMAKEWLSKLDSNTVERLYSIYKADFIMMNYSNFTDPNFPLPLNEENKSSQ